MEFDQLRTFIAVLEHGSFTRAAEALGLSQSTVSFHIKTLESAVKVRLLDRNRERVMMTVAGRTLSRYATQMLALRSEAVANLRAQNEGTVGRVNVAASTIPGEYLLPGILGRLRRHRPGIGVRLQISDSRRALAALVEGEQELALVGSVSRDRKLVSQVFAFDEVVLVGPAPNPFSIAREEDLARVPLILRPESSGTRAAVAQLLARDANRRGDVVTIEVDSTEATKRCVLEGLGLAFASRLSVAQEIERGQMTIVPLPGLPVRREFFVVSRRGATLSAAASILVEELVGGAAQAG